MSKLRTLDTINPRVHNKEYDIMDIIKTVEDTIKESDTYLTQRQLLAKLPINVPFPTLRLVLDLFKQMNKIVYDRDNTIVWVGTDELQNKIFEKEFTLLH
ncbi:MAG: hypothetical protein ACRD8W_01970 [Nitrososphaeraceae archaeon]